MNMDSLHSLPKGPIMSELSQKFYSGQWFKGGSQEIMVHRPNLVHQLFCTTYKVFTF